MQLQYGLSKRLALTLTSGYYNFLPKTFVGGYNDLVRFQTNSYGIVPVKAGIKYFIIVNIYLAAEAGVAQEVSKNTGVTISGFAYGYQYNDNQYGYTKLILSPGLGLALKYFDFRVRYESFSGSSAGTFNSANYGMVSLHVAYNLLNDKSRNLADQNLSFSIGPETGIVTGYEKTYHDAEIGFIGRLQYQINSYTAIIFTTGYYNLLSKLTTAVDAHFGGGSYQTPSLSYGIVPVKLGLKQSLGNNFYISGEAGLGKETSPYVYLSDNDYEYQQTRLIIAPGLGYAYKRWDTGLSFDFFHGRNINYGILGLHLLHSF